mmetsp:Transcript_12886/g.9327  ORF Transcript_12886/g.9327 Transcript_12886/m.9327 type:complete len:124 (+) Transcript_12886:631-1002(+)
MKGSSSILSFTNRSTEISTVCNVGEQFGYGSNVVLAQCFFTTLDQFYISQNPQQFYRTYSTSSVGSRRETKIQYEEDYLDKNSQAPSPSNPKSSPKYNTNKKAPIEDEENLILLTEEDLWREQ